VAFTTLIDVSSLQQLQLDRTVAVIDCRFDLAQPEAGRRAFLDAHIPGARYADLNQDLSARMTATSGRHPLPAPRAFAATLERLGIGDDTQVIAYDDANGSIAARLWWMLRWLGHTSVAVLDGGFKAWRTAGGALESGQELPLPGTVRFSPRVDASAVIATADVADWLRDPDKLLVDARAAERYAGSTEPIDPVAGHIPGAVNQPFSLNLDPEGRFLPAPELKRRWQVRLGCAQPRNVAAMCGSGVTACHNLLGLEVAGLPGAKLYAGSWSEWIKDPARPTGHDATDH
jgi:thiosulfate/3-mercaptopyruvate sulfurtransferase